MTSGPDAGNPLEQAAVTNEHSPTPLSPLFESSDLGDSVTDTERGSLVRLRGQCYYNNMPTLIPAVQSCFQAEFPDEDIAIPDNPDYPDFGAPAHTFTYTGGWRWTADEQIYFKAPWPLPEDRVEHYRLILKGASHNGTTYSYDELLCYKKTGTDPFTDADLTLPPFFKLGEHQRPRHLWDDDMAGFVAETSPFTLSLTRLFQSLHAIKVRHLARLKRKQQNEYLEIFFGRSAPFQDIAYLTDGDLKQEDPLVEGVGFFGVSAPGVIIAYGILNAITEADYIAEYRAELEAVYHVILTNGTPGTQFSHAAITGYNAPILFIPFNPALIGMVPFGPALAPDTDPGADDTKRLFYIEGASAFADLSAWDAIPIDAEYGFTPLPNVVVPAGVRHTVYLDIYRIKVQQWKKTYYQAGHLETWDIRNPWDPPPPAPVFFPVAGYVDYPADGTDPVDDELISEEWHDIICPHLVWAPFED